jgi:hypothetical protein
LTIFDPIPPKGGSHNGNKHNGAIVPKIEMIGFEKYSVQVA